MNALDVFCNCIIIVVEWALSHQKIQQNGFKGLEVTTKWLQHFTQFFTHNYMQRIIICMRTMECTDNDGEMLKIICWFRFDPNKWLNTFSCFIPILICHISHSDMMHWHEICYCICRSHVFQKCIHLHIHTHTTHDIREKKYSKRLMILLNVRKKFEIVFHFFFFWLSMLHYKQFNGNWA